VILKKDNFISSLYITNWFFLLLAIGSGLFVLSFLVEQLFYIAQLYLVLFFSYTVIDILILFSPKQSAEASRTLKEQLNLGDVNPVYITIKNNHTVPVKVTVVDELPYQFQIRDFERSDRFEAGEEKTLYYSVRPVKRGQYKFGSLNIYVRSFLGMVERRYRASQDFEAKVYPSVVQMRKLELKVFTTSNLYQGVKKVRRLGNNQEFEQIKNYVQGDDFRKINWKATSRRGELMVNQYQDEKSQSVYSIIDKSRVMKMPFNDMSLLDYSINSTLAISNIALRKDDKVGLMTFSDKLGVHVKAEKLGGQLAKILEHLYRQKTRYNESNFEMLYYGVRQNIQARSLVFIYTNFESVYAMERALPMLRKISKLHLLVVIFFENTELLKASENRAETVEDIYFQTFAEKNIIEKRTIAAELQQYGINSILTTPEKLSVDTINKYLDLKARGAI
tara:strand:- start:3345 stop:4691 length:1347 start_codon:yes stop_codon:yes gene_type:complete